MSRVVLAHGCWDLFHQGHLAHLEAARKFGDRLVVGVTSDRYVNKGPLRPHFKQEERAAMLRALKCVDEVIINDHPTAVPLLERIRPAIFAKGSDYISGICGDEAKAVERLGIEVSFTTTERNSSSELINKYFEKWSPEQLSVISRVKEAGGLGLIEQCFEKLEVAKILLVGEDILDVYSFCRPGGVSSKSPSLSVNIVETKAYEGGVRAVASLLKEFSNVETVTQEKKIVKQRFVEPSKNQHLFEVCDYPEITHQESFYERLYTANPVIVCDFGHGLIDAGALKILKDNPGFIAVNAQTNSSNFGFNRFQRHERASYLCVDTREARLAFADRQSDIRALSAQATGLAEVVSVTLGADGALFDSKAGLIHCPAFSGPVVDAIGAGDVYYGMTSLMLLSGAPDIVTAFVGNVAAGIKTGILGHQRITKPDILRACAAILK